MDNGLKTFLFNTIHIYFLIEKYINGSILLINIQGAKIKKNRGINPEIVKLLEEAGVKMLPPFDECNEEEKKVFLDLVEEITR